MPRESRAADVLPIAPPPRGTMTEEEGERRVFAGARRVTALPRGSGA